MIMNSQLTENLLSHGGQPMNIFKTNKQTHTHLPDGLELN